MFIYLFTIIGGPCVLTSVDCSLRSALGALYLLFLETVVSGCIVFIYPPVLMAGGRTASLFGSGLFTKGSYIYYYYVVAAF